MKDAWDRLRQCISPTTSMPHGGNNTLPILNQAFQFVCGGSANASPSSPTLPGGQTCGQADPKAITFAIMQQQQRAEVESSLVFLTGFFQDWILIPVSLPVAPGGLVSDDVLPVQDGGEERRVSCLPAVSCALAVCAASVPLWLLCTGNANHWLSHWDSV